MIVTVYGHCIFVTIIEQFSEYGLIIVGGKFVYKPSPCFDFFGENILVWDRLIN